MEQPISEPLNAGTVLQGDYEIVRLMGRGGMGELYEARHTRLPKRFAVKVIRRELVTEPGLFNRFKREAEITSSLGNRHIVDVNDFNLLPDGSPFMVMELLQGEDLATRLKRQGRLSLAETRELLRQLALGLGAAHQSGVLHRDIKPENLFLARDGAGEVLKVLDFGLSKMSGGSRVTLTQSVMGTPAYMSPEQATGKLELDARADIYSVGVVLYQLLSGRVPFEGANPYQVLSKIVHDPPPPLENLAPELEGPVSAIIARTLAKDREARPSSMEQLWSEFAAAAEASAVESTAPSRFSPPPLALQPTVLSPVPGASELLLAKAFPKRNFWYALLAGFGVLLVATATWTVINRSPEKQTAALEPPHAVVQPPELPKPELSKPMAPPLPVPAPIAKPVAVPIAPAVAKREPPPVQAPPIAHRTTKVGKHHHSAAPSENSDPEPDASPYAQ